MPTAKREAARKPRKGVVYFVRAETLGLIKIGSAVNPDRRLTGLQCGSPDRLQLVAYVGTDDIIAGERAMHRRFNHHREHHEWFRPGADLLAYIEEYAVRVIKRKRPKRAEEIVRETVMARRAALHIAPPPTSSPTASREADERPRIPPGIEAPKGNSRKARMARYKLARGIA